MLVQVLIIEVDACLIACWGLFSPMTHYGTIIQSSTLLPVWLRPLSVVP